MSLFSFQYRGCAHLSLCGRKSPVRGSLTLPVGGSWVWVVMASVAMLALAACGRHGLAQELSDSDAVAIGGDALADSGNYPWYDESTGKVRRINVAGSADADSANRDSKWTKQPTASTGGGVRWGWPAISWGFHYLFIFVFILLLGIIVYLIARAFLKDETREDAVVRRTIETSRDVDRVQSLPIQLRKPTSDFLAEARRLYEAGDYSEAMIYLFSHELVLLDKHHVIRLAKGKTNRQYLRETRQRPVLRGVLEPAIIAFEDVFFGRKRLSRERFEACWNRLDEFHAELEHLERAAA
jgi:hypothetical protein